ncbi:hypothetical protein P3102_10540 [Amycolatopsis sp. QT-25]|uniref:hypothetical protein n=1 Tax=Amycolatopsis sp. QT-25 TaxID=3034022 RepID=UPI0023EB9055|nr:hypothetical protein [Amycolatopsis sp. QT-25]WET81612.1 hypothetical protein P3102_10540 [Amycolatopsis sp. QT-25]
MDLIERTRWSHSCSWTDLAMAESVFVDARNQLAPDTDSSRRWTAAGRFVGGEVVVPARDLNTLSIARREPVRRFSWSRDQKHRPGLEFLVSTGRHP